MIMRISFILVLFVSLGCSQISVPGFLAWEYEYCYAYPESTPPDSLYLYKLSPDDSINTVFNMYISYQDSGFIELGETDDLRYSLIQHNEFYSNIFVWFYATAEIESYQIDGLWRGGIESDPSDTIKVYFPVLSPGEPIEFEVLELNMK